ncbi:uncharacterized protein LOC129732246 isoform X2 [Wyeomyia smithii]|uniref:uncharacterized protein LOC129732246 isoform X2 n=1 Tax=Wyeomyia smithii TaxID=174621 RepID=UPI00246800E1|nr:uncharacterized protein LOC129732246 isoform X2 [Wyeomyia smithii]
MQKIPSFYHIGQDEITCRFYIIRPSHHSELKPYLYVISCQRKNAATLANMICYVFLSFVIMNRIIRVNLTCCIHVTNNVNRNLQYLKQPHIFCNKLAYVGRLFQQQITIDWKDPLYCWLKLIYFNFIAKQGLYNRIASRNFNKISRITAVFQTEVERNSKPSSCLDPFDQTTSKHNSVQFENRFSTDYCIKYCKSFIYEQHKYTIDGIDYMYKILKNAIYNQSTSNNRSGIYVKRYTENEIHQQTKLETVCIGECSGNLCCPLIGKTKFGIIVERKNQIESIITNYASHHQITSTQLHHQRKFCCCILNSRRTEEIKTSGKSATSTKILKILQINLQLLLLLWLCVPNVSSSYQNVRYSTNIIKTKYGPIRGILKHSNPIVETFLGVPYASPPVGNLRYMPPVTPSMWKTVRLADNYSPVCHQTLPKSQFGSDYPDIHLFPRLTQLRRLLPLLANQSEDCLYLNLYVPRSGESVEPYGPPKATIVYIHGESYEWSSGNLYDGSVLAAVGDVILVTINFRLGVLGFLKTGAKGSAQGNFGLMDIVAALHWLRENLSSFHGDPKRITLMGHGTGAALANILVVSPVANDIIDRVILLSGSALSPWAIQKDPIAVKRIVAEQTACHLDITTEDLAPCLRTKPVKELLHIYPNNPRFLPGFAPFVDGTVIINRNAVNLRLKSLPSGSAITSTTGIEFANFPTQNLLFGLTSYESYYDLNEQDLDYGINETRRDKILRTYVRNVFHIHLKEIYSALRNEYTDWEHPPRSPLGHRDTILELLSDGHTAAPLVRLGYLHSLQNGKSYFLHFRHQTSEREFPLRDGSVRGEDVPFTFGLPLSPLFSSNYTQEDKQISRTLMQYLTNFAKTGNPNSLRMFNLENISENNKVNIPYHSDNVQHNKLEFRKKSLLGERMSLFNNQRMNTMYERDTFSNNDGIAETGRLLTDGYMKNDKTHRNEPNVKPNLLRYNSKDAKDETNENENTQSSRNLENWEFYDPTNQIYLELGCSALSRSHYRGHKLSMWLSLIPQLHSPDDASYLPVRHHHFAEVKSEYYEGKVRSQPVLKASKLTTFTRSTTKPLKTAPIVVTLAETTSKDCPPNVTELIPVAAENPQHNQMTIVGNNVDVMNQLANMHYQNYSVAFNITIGVGCFLLLLNVLIFAAIYYQREKHANQNKKKVAVDDEVMTTLSVNKQLCHETNVVCKDDQRDLMLNLGKNTSEVTVPPIESKSGATNSTKKKHIVVDICTTNVSANQYERPLSKTSCYEYPQHVSFKTVKAVSHENLLPSYSSQLSSVSDSSSNTTSVCTHMRRNSLATMGTQSESICWPETQDIGTSVDEIDLEFSSMMPSASQSPRATGFQSGILRQQTSAIVHGTTKKRVQIQEISV